MIRIFLLSLLAVLAGVAVPAQSPQYRKPMLKELGWVYAQVGDGPVWNTSIFTTNTDTIPPKASGWTNDFEHLFSAKEIRVLDSLIEAYEKKTTNEIAIVTIRKDQTTPEQFDDYVLRIHNAWGVGKKQINNGIVIGISRELRKVRISTGYGMESKLTNEEAKTIIETTMLPEFSKGNMFEGTRNGLLAIMRE